MNEEERRFHDHSSTQIAQVVRRLLPLVDAITRRKSPSMDEVHADYRLIACMVALARQRESLLAAIKLSEDTLGHLAVGFIRPACEEYLWLKYLTSLECKDSNDVLLVLASSDALRSLSAARGYIGDPMLNKLGFPTSFLSTTQAGLDSARERLAALRQRLAWDGKSGPTARWLAARVGEVRLYDYLYAASSRAVHFSAGEVFRRTWFDIDGTVSVEDADHRIYLSDFALYQLVDLAIRTFVVAADWLANSSNDESGDQEFSEEILKPLEEFNRLPQVPLIIAKEYEIAWGAGLQGWGPKGRRL
ncbi:DUF5677 domain-containing protein [Micromonospora sp. NPDC049662]|uniref:DUF5677 domain-containing protein n=1 Tax=Micromonospora sp. NPDC049662 TaxID=3155397 RepID=UPI0034299112